MNDAVLISERIETHDGAAIGVLTLNRHKALNALNTELIAAVKQQLQQWQQDQHIQCIWLQGSDKALCAGGDIREVQAFNQHDPANARTLAADFFQQEYGLYSLMANYPKPIVTWASGIVMGGGLGLAAASSIRIVTETTLMAMPEISIGLFPDAGATWFLQRFPFHSGLFLGLTGARFNGQDALLGNLAEYALPSDQREATLAALQAASWREPALQVIKRVLAQQPSAALPPSQILQHQEAILDIVKQADFQLALARIEHWANTSEWLQSAADYVRSGCASSAGLHWLLMHQCRYWSLDEVLALEHTVAVNCTTRADFIEGVRALLIDKDKNPQWCKSATEVDASWLQTFLQPLTSSAPH